MAIALGENSAPAGRLVGDKIVHIPKAIDVGFAVEAEDGVLVPVLRDADKTPVAQIVARYNELVELARQRRLPANAQGGSIATVTNFGTFGLEWATPIPLPEQTLVLRDGRRADYSALGQGQGPIRPRDRGPFHAQLRSPRPRRRRRGAALAAHRSSFDGACEVVV